MVKKKSEFNKDNLTLLKNTENIYKVIKFESLGSTCLIEFWLFLTKHDDFYLKPKRNSQMAQVWDQAELSPWFQGRVFPFSPMYSIWEIDEIIRGELYRNICMASLAITIATIFLLSDLVSACFVILCVFITLTNVSGIMYFWGKFLGAIHKSRQNFGGYFYKYPLPLPHVGICLNPTF